MLVDLDEAVAAALLGFLAAGEAFLLALLFGRHDLGLPRGRQVDELQVDIVVRRRLFPTAASAAAPRAPAVRREGDGGLGVKAPLKRDKFTDAGAGADRGGQTNPDTESGKLHFNRRRQEGQFPFQSRISQQRST